MTLYLLGAMTVLSVQPHWRKAVDKVHRWLSKGCVAKGVGGPIPADHHLARAEARARAAADWGQHTREFHALIGAAWAPSTEDSWGSAT